MTLEWKEDQENWDKITRKSGDINEVEDVG